MSLFLVVKSSFYFYFTVYCLVAVLSLLVCLEDIDHSTIVCPRVLLQIVNLFQLGNHIKHQLLSLFRPFKPELIDAFLQLLIGLDYIYLSLLVFSGVMVIVSAFLYTLWVHINYFIFSSYYTVTSLPPFIRKLAFLIFKVVCLVSFIAWLLIYR